MVIWEAAEQWWADIPLALLRAELVRREEQAHEKSGTGTDMATSTAAAAAETKTETPACGSQGLRGSYNTTLHVLALFLILVLSTLGMF